MLTFPSNAFVPAGAEWNPVSALVAGVRTLFGNPTALPENAAWPLQHRVLSDYAADALALPGAHDRLTVAVARG
jgi:ABC-2 type transport system permease protein